MEEKLAEKELKDQAQQVERIPLPSPEEAGETDVKMIMQRIQEIQRVLLNFKQLADPSATRQEYVKQLIKDCCSYYGYNDWLMEQFYHLFSVSEVYLPLINDRG